jgi:hypothetical protein
MLKTMDESSVTDSQFQVSTKKCHGQRADALNLNSLGNMPINYRLKFYYVISPKSSESQFLNWDIKVQMNNYDVRILRRYKIPFQI